MVGAVIVVVALIIGVLAVAAISLGKLTMEDLPVLVRVTDRFEPNPRASAVYEPMYAEFKKFYGSLHGSYARLNSMTPGK